MREDLQISNFTKGEVSPKNKGRTDWEGYFDALDTEFNMVSLAQGGATRRPPTIFGALAKDQTDSAGRVQLLPFLFGIINNGTSQAYMFECGQSYVRVFMNDAPVLNVAATTGAANNGSGLIRLAIAASPGLYTGNTMTVSGVAGTTEANGTWTVTVIDSTHVDLQGSTFTHTYTGAGSTSTPVEIPVPYQAADWPAVEWTQSADTLYLDGGACPGGTSSNGYPPATLTRSSHTVWTYTVTTYHDGPYLPLNTTTTTLTPNGTTGSITITASATTGINNGAGFLASDVGRLIRLKDSAAYGWCIITAVTDTTHVVATVQAAVNLGAAGVLDGTSGTTSWQLGKWSSTTGWPYIPMFWQQRLTHLGTNNQPSAVEASVSADFTNLAANSSDGTTTVANNALSWVISDDQVNAVRWASPAGSSAAMQLGIGTTGGEQILQQATTSQALSPTNVQVYRESTYGSAQNVRPIRVGKSVLFANRPGRKLHDWQWSWPVNGYIGPDLTVDAEHITRSTPSTLQGITRIAYQQNPLSIAWCTKGDGSLVAMTYLPEQKVVAWHRHQLGGQYYGGWPIVESVACIPSPDGSYDEIWFSVLRTIGGVVTRTIEIMDRFFDALPLEQARYMDCSLTSTLSTTAATLTPPALPAVPHPGNSTINPGDVAAYGGTGTYTANSAVFNSGMVGSYIRMNGGIALITAYTDSTHVTAETYAPMRNLKPATSGTWSVDAPQTTFGGMGIFNGETVQVIGDGADMGTQVVSGGDIVLPSGQSASYASAGLPYMSVLITMPWEPARIAVSAQGKPKQISMLYIRFHETVAANYGQRVTDATTHAVTSKTQPLDTRQTSNPLGQAPPLATNIQRLSWPGTSDLEGQIEINTNGPFPMTVVSIGAIADVGDMAA